VRIAPHKHKTYAPLAISGDASTTGLSLPLEDPAALIRPAAAVRKHVPTSQVIPSRYSRFTGEGATA